MVRNINMNTPKPKLYLGGPITGLSWEECTDWRQDLALQLSDVADCYSPLRHKHYLCEEKEIRDDYPNTFFSTQRAIFGRDMFDVRTSDILFVNFIGAKRVSIGTVLEIGAAWEGRKTIVIVMEPGNIHQHSMIRELTPWVVDTLEAGVEVVKSLYTQ